MNSNSRARIRTAQSMPDAETNKFDPWLLWATFRRCWMWMIPVGLVLASIVVVLLIQNFEPRYRAHSLLQANQDYIAYKGVTRVSGDLARTEKAVIFNRVVLEPVLLSLGDLGSESLCSSVDAEMMLRKNLSVTSGGSSVTLRLSYEDPSPEAAAKVCNAIVESYLRMRSDLDQSRISALEGRLEPEIERARQRVADDEQRFTEMTKEAIGYNPGEKASAVVNEGAFALYARLQSQLSDLKQGIAFAKIRLKVLEEDYKVAVEKAGAGGVSPVAMPVLQEPTDYEVNTLIRSHPNIRSIESEIKRYEARVRQIEDADVVGIKRAEYNRFKANVYQLSQQLVVEQQKLYPIELERLKQVAKEQYDRQLVRAKQLAKASEGERQFALLQEVNQQRKKVREMKDSLEVVSSHYEEETQRLRKFGGKTAQLRIAERELAMSQGVWDVLRKRLLAVRTERQRGGSVVKVTDATAPSLNDPIEKLPYKKILMASLVAMLLPFAVGLLFEFKARRLTTSDMCDKNGMVVIGEVAKLPPSAKHGRERRVYEESIDTLRSSLFLSTETRDSRSFAVVSSMSGEGKSSVSSQLALSIARATGETVLLIDADLRCPDQHDIFGLDLGDGLAGVLAEEVSLDSAIDKSLGDRIHVLPAGKLRTTPHRLITPSSMSALVQQALELYTYVVVDTAPVLAAGESLAVASAVDSSLLCVMRDVSRVDNIARTTKRLEAVGANLIGTVFSGVTARQYAYRYGDYRYGVSADGNAS